MPRPSSKSASKRRTSLRLSGEDPASINVASVAAARPRSSSSSDSSTNASSTFLETGKAAPGSVPSNSRGQGKKRAASRFSAEPKAAKKRQTSRPSLSITPGDSRPLTRSQKSKSALKVITPSPAAFTPSDASPAFSFSSPQKRGSFTLPEGVIDLYSSQDVGNEVCNCGQDDCSSNATTSSFLRSYGKEYFQYLKTTETPDIALPSPSSSSTPSSRSSRSTIFSPNNHADSPMSTPEHNRDWVFLNPEAVDRTQPQPAESTKYLPNQPDLTPKMRSILVDWIIELSEHFNFGPTTLHLAVTLVDKVLACGPLRLDDDSEDEGDSDEEDESKTTNFLISRERFQLLGAACTWVACKIEEMSPPNVDDFAYVSDNIYSTSQIKRMERRICKALNWNCWHVTPLLFTSEMMRASHECPKLFCHSKTPPIFHNMVMYMLELGRLPYIPVTKNPSLLAASAVYLSRCNLGVQSSDTSLDPLGRWTKTLEYYTGYSKAELKETVLTLHKYHSAAEESTLKSVYAKYKSRKYLKVALKTCPSSEADLGYPE